MARVARWVGYVSERTSEDTTRHDRAGAGGQWVWAQGTSEVTSDIGLSREPHHAWESYDAAVQSPVSSPVTVTTITRRPEKPEGFLRTGIV